jgi:hypothetical protein
MRILFRIICVILIFSSCSESETPNEENVGLKSNLQGTWERTFGEQGSSFFVSQVTFADYEVTSYDSMVIMTDELNGEIQTRRGKCPVSYTFNDGVQHYNPRNTTHVYTFSGTTENDILWVYIEDGEKSKIVDYQIINGVVTVLEQWTTSTPVSSIHSSFVRFANNFNTAEFCYPLASNPCSTYEKVM